MMNENCGQALKTCEDTQRSPLEILRLRKSSLDNELKETTEAIEALEANPEIANVLEKVGRVLRRY